MYTCGCFFLYFNVLMCVFHTMQNNIFLLEIFPVAPVAASKPSFWFQNQHSRSFLIVELNPADIRCTFSPWHHIYISGHFGLYMGSPDCACIHNDKLAKVRHLTRCYYSSISDKKDKVLQQFVYLPWLSAMAICQSQMDDVFGWLSRNDIFASWLAYVSSPPIETERDRETREE